MPRYDYRCRTCDASFEVTRSMTDTAPASCPDGHTDCSRVFTAVAVGGSAAAPAPAGGCCGGGCCG
ncbi:MAG: zinc ribbon domain-containing protein [Mycobacteriales bacterium]|nr:zinc ribbon domain-containing protein [Mycobacteriales bacterium]